MKFLTNMVPLALPIALLLLAGCRSAPEAIPSNDKDCCIVTMAAPSQPAPALRRRRSVHRPSACRKLNIVSRPSTEPIRIGGNLCLRLTMTLPSGNISMVAAVGRHWGIRKFHPVACFWDGAGDPTSQTKNSVLRGWRVGIGRSSVVSQSNNYTISPRPMDFQSIFIRREIPRLRDDWRCVNVPLRRCSTASDRYQSIRRKRSHNRPGRLCQVNWMLTIGRPTRMSDYARGMYEQMLEIEAGDRREAPQSPLPTPTP